MIARLFRALLCLAVASIGWTAAGAARAEPSAPPASAAAGVDRRIGAPLPLSTGFRASDGRAVALGDVVREGKPALLVLAYSRCTMLCSLVLRRLTALVPELGLRAGEDYSLVTISIDPTDSVFEAARLQASLLDAAGLPGQNDRWAFLIGERPAIDAVAAAVGFRYVWDPSTEQYAHPAVLITITSQGEVSGYFDGLAPDPTTIRAALTEPAPIARLLEQGLSRKTIEQTLSSCFRFDTAHSRYGTLLGWSLRGLAASVSLGLMALLWRLGHKTRRGPAGGRP